LKPKKRVKKTSNVDIARIYERVVSFLDRQGSSNIFSNLETFKKQFEEQEHVRKVVKDIDKIENKIEKASKSRNDLEILIKKLFRGEKNIVFSNKEVIVNTKDGKNIGLSSLSSGEKHVLMLFIYNLIAAESTLIIDEPEISLNIDWQKQLVASMQKLNPKVQLILATHSPEVMANTPDSKIFAL